MARFIPCAETAKLVRQVLKKNFAGITFSVRSKQYSGGASIGVEWTDGPARSAVEDVVKIFNGATFDGMTDSTTYHSTVYNGEEVNFGANYVMCTRKMTRPFVQCILNAYYAKYPEYVGRIKIVGSFGDARVDAWELGHYAEHGINDLLRETDEKNRDQPYESAEEARREQERAKARREQEERQRQYRERQQTKRVSSVPFTRQQALAYLGLGFSATDAQIVKAFRQKVKLAADGNGGYKGDMDALVKAKEAALK